MNMEFKMSMMEYDDWEERAVSWLSTSNIDCTLAKTQQVFYKSIVSDELWLSISKQVTVTSTFKKCIELGRKAYNSNKNKFVLIRVWQDLKREKDEPSSIHLEKMLLLADWCDLRTTTVDQRCLSKYLKENPE